MQSRKRFQIAVVLFIRLFNFVFVEVELTQLIIMVNDNARSKGLTSKPPNHWQ